MPEFIGRRRGHSQIRISRLRAAITAIVATVAVILTTAVIAQAASPKAAVPVIGQAGEDTKSADDKQFSAKNDLVSARIAAREQKTPVEVVDERTESSSTWVLPTGQMRKDTHPAPVRVQKDDGSWVDIDLTLVKDGDGWTPKSAPRPVTFSDGGDEPVVTFSHLGRSIEVGWAGDLPEPTVEGNTATYVLSAQQDLVLTARPEGFEQSVILKSAPATGEQIDPVVLPLNLNGVKAIEGPSGSASFTATEASGKGETEVEKGEDLFGVATPVMYSAATDEKTGEPTQIVPLDTELVTTAAEAPHGADAGITLTPDEEFLRDPQTVYPVTIDPVIGAVDAMGDTWIRSGDSTPHGTDTQLNIGGWTTSTQNSIALIKFSDAQFDDQHVTNATLTLHNSYAASCTGAGVGVYALAADWNPATVTWANRPNKITDSQYVTWKNFAHGFDTSCPAAAEAIDITRTAQAWGWNDVTNYGFQIETDNTSPDRRKSFCAFDVASTGICNSATKAPKLSVTYNSYPWPPEQVTAVPQTEGTNGTTYVTTTQPEIQAKLGNSDGTPVRPNIEISYDPVFPADGTGVFWSGDGAAVTPLSTAAVKVGAALTNGKHYRYRIRSLVVDGAGGTDTSPWSDYTPFVVHTTTPAAPSITCSPYSSATWTPQTDSANCTIDTTAADGSGYYWSLDNPSPDTLIDDASNSGAAKTIVVTPKEGPHTLYVRARDIALAASAVTSYTFGVGNGGILTPAENDSTEQVVSLSAQSASSRTQVTYSYRPGTLTTGSWTTVPTAHVRAPGNTSAIASWPQVGATSGAQTTFTPLNWNAAATLQAAGGTDGPVQVRACFTQANSNQWCTSGTTFLLASKDFGNSSATSSIGPGSVSLVTGNYNISANDVSEGDLSVGRTYTSLVPAAASAGPEGVFGPGWTIDAFGGGGEAEVTLSDHSSQGYVTLTAPSGTQITYTKSGDVYRGVGDANDGSTLTRSTSIRNPADATDTAVYAGWQLTLVDGTVTIFLAKPGDASVYLSRWVDGPGTESETTLVRDANGLVTRIVAPAPAGVDCRTAMSAGCQALNVVYASSTTATGTSESTWGDYSGRVKAVTFTIYDPAILAMSTTTVASYLYDSTGHLRTQWDPRFSTPLKTRYTYDANGRVSSLAPPGRAAWSISYDSSGRLADVARTDPANGIAKQSVVYDIPISGSGTPLDLSLAQTSAWNQKTDLPYKGTALFPASRVPAVTTVNGVSGVHAAATEDWPHAALTYTNVSGQVVNTAVYGAGAWQVESRRHDANNNVVWTLSAGNRLRALDPSTAVTAPYVAAQPSSANRADLLATIESYSPDGVDHIAQLSPTRQVHLAAGAWASVRVRTSYAYDQGAPDSDAHHLVTTTTTASIPVDGTPTTASDTRKTLTGYAPIDGTSSTGTTSGWTLGQATTDTTVMEASTGSADIIRRYRYDAAGRQVEERMPESGGGDAGTTVSTFYTADDSASVASCRNKPQWAGKLCQTRPAAQPTGTTVPTVNTTYSKWGTPATVVESSGDATRTVTQSYDAAGRLSSESIAVTPASEGGAVLPVQTVGYDATTGEATSWSRSGDSVSATFNSLGQQTSYTDADGNVSSTTYTIDGLVATRHDGKGTYAYTYDGTDAAGQSEHRGLVTSMTAGMGSRPSTSTAAYDADGQLIEQVYPNGIIATRTYDASGGSRSLHYTNRGYAWMSYDQAADRDGHVVWSTGPLGQSDYGYDNNNRLISVRDRVLGQCSKREFTFSKNGNRTALKSILPDASGACSGAASTVASTYDAVDRITNTGYAYDKLGRTTAMPANNVSGQGAVSVDYFASDAVAQITQSTAVQSFTLDPAQRQRTTKDTLAGTETRRTVNHYSESADSPTWIAASTNAGTSWTWQRNVVGIDGGLMAIQDNAGNVQIQLVNLHDDVVATVDDDTSAIATNAYFEQTEYGLPRITNPSNPEQYGWLGGAQRVTTPVGGIMQMGVRLYNPTTGRFLSPDPVPGGNENAYIYPNDPVNQADPSGKNVEYKFRERCTTIGCYSFREVCNNQQYCRIDWGLRFIGTNFYATNIQVWYRFGINNAWHSGWEKYKHREPGWYYWHGAWGVKTGHSWGYYTTRFLGIKYIHHLRPWDNFTLDIKMEGFVNGRVRTGSGYSTYNWKMAYGTS